MAVNAKMPSVKIEQITPAMADKYLSTMTRNRKLRDSAVVKFCHIIERGEWKLTTDAIGFDTAGHLINGQHRLTACVVSGTPLMFIVVRNLNAETQDILDTNLIRSTADALKLAGESDVFALAASLRWIYRFDYIEKSGGKDVHFRDPGENPTTPQLMKIFNKERDAILDCVPLRRKAVTAFKLKPGVTGAIMYRQRQIDVELEELFWNSLIDGINLKSKDPIYLLRKIVESDARARGGKRMADFRQAALIVRAWNLWTAGEERESLHWHYGPLNKDAFPLFTDTGDAAVED